MPNFPAFQKRLAQLNNPFYRDAADTPIEFGISAQQAMGPNPMQRPSGGGRSIPLVQNAAEIPSSGTSSDQPMMSAAKTKQAIAQQVEYGDVAPKLEEIPGDPAFDAHKKHGFGDRLRAMLYGAQGAMAQQPDNQFASIGGAIGGLINPGGAERLNYEEVTLPRARKKQQATIARNESRQKAFQTEMQGRLAVAKVNQANRPEYASMPGGEYSTLYNKANPDDQRLVMGPDGKPQRVASIVNTEKRTESAEDLLFQRNLAQAERDAEKKKAAFEMEAVKNQHAKEKAEMEQRFKKMLEEYRQSQMNNRFSKGEAGKSGRANQAEAGRNKRFTQRYGDNGAVAPGGSTGGSTGKKTAAPPAN